MEATISFADIVKDREATVRITDDKMIYVIDLIMVVTGKNRNEAGMAFRRISDELLSSINLIERKTPGKGNANTKLITFQNAIELIMVLPGKIAKETRTKFADIIHRYMAGDGSLAEEIQYNQASEAPICQLARESLSPELDAVSINRKRNREELETSVKLGHEYVLSLEKTTQYLQQAIALRKEFNCLEIEHVKQNMELLDVSIEKEKLKLNIIEESHAKERVAELEHERAKMALADEDRAKSLAYERAKKEIVMAPHEPVVIAPLPVNEPTITVLNVYLKNKARFPNITKKQEGSLLSNAGRAVKEAYKTKTGEIPSTKDENGQFMVAAYPLAEEPLIVETLSAEYRKLLAGSTPTLQKFFVMSLN